MNGELLNAQNMVISIVKTHIMMSLVKVLGIVKMLMVSLKKFSLTMIPTRLVISISMTKLMLITSIFYLKNVILMSMELLNIVNSNYVLSNVKMLGDKNSVMLNSELSSVVLLNLVMKYVKENGTVWTS